MATSVASSSLQKISKALAPSGVLRCGINLSNFLLVSSKDPPRGVSPSMATALGAKLNVPVEFITYENPGKLADAAEKEEWDVGLIGAEPQRAAIISFTQPYCEIQATYLVAATSPITSIEEVDKAGNRVAVSRRTAYCLWLENHLQHAELRQTAEPGLDLSRQLYADENLEVLAGLRPWLLTQADGPLRGSRVLDGSFTSVKQAIGIPRRRADADTSMFLERFVAEAIASGLVSQLIAEHEQQAGRVTPRQRRLLKLLIDHVSAREYATECATSEASNTIFTAQASSAAPQALQAATMAVQPREALLAAIPLPCELDISNALMHAPASV
eukprot:jgi/Chrpa1/5209/Chrysochromulina_OHIO_Genome00002624-RA